MTNGCFALANIEINFKNNKLKRFSAALGDNFVPGGCLPINNSNSGITSIIACTSSPNFSCYSVMIFCNFTSGSLKICLINC